MSIELYNNLLKLCDSSESEFYFVDHHDQGAKYRIFSYRLASYTDFCKPDALEARGIMFEIDDNDNYVRLACRPPKKFFNFRENPFTIDIDFEKNPIETVTVKEDGSLISTYTDTIGKLRLKSKTSLSSQQSTDAYNWLQNQTDLKEALERAELNGWTVSLEWCSPNNRIVISYEEPKLVVLQLRNRETGIVAPYETMKEWFGQWTVDAVTNNGQSTLDFIQQVYEETGNVEGIVATCKDGLMFKVKTLKYASLHKIKDSISSPRRLFEAVLDGGTDDIRGWFADDPLVIKEIDEMESKVREIKKTNILPASQFFQKYQDLDRKEFAIKGQKELSGIGFTVAMCLYNGKSLDWNELLKKNFKKFGISDE